MDYWLREFSTPGNNGTLTASEDSLIVSILSVAFPGILVYLVLWVVMPSAERAV